MRSVGSTGDAERAQRYSPRPMTDGERWTADGLGDLRRRRFRPGAWVVFLRSALERSRASRSQRPELARQAATWGVTGAAAWSAACVAARRRSDLDTTADLAFLTAAALSANRAGRLTRVGRWALLARHAIGLAIALGAVFGRARRPAIRARPWGAVPRVAGLALTTAGWPRTGTLLLVAGCLVPPRSTAPSLSPA
jgi:hypothetical protein